MALEKVSDPLAVTLTAASVMDTHAGLAVLDDVNLDDAAVWSINQINRISLPQAQSIPPRLLWTYIQVHSACCTELSCKTRYRDGRPG